MMKTTIVLTLAAMFAAGCGGEPTLDATSDATVDASVKRMTEAMPEARRPEFARAVMMAAMPRDAIKARMQAAARGEPVAKASTAELYRPMHGMTADEIIAGAASSSRPAPGP